MLKCFRCECKNHAVYECLKEDFIVYACNSHVIDESSSLPIEYNSMFEAQLSSYKLMIDKKKQLLALIKSSVSKLEKSNKLMAAVKPANPSNQFLMNGLIKLRSAAGQSQNRNQAHIYKLSIRALQKYPLPIIHPEQATDLQGLGPSSLKSLHKIFRDAGVFYKNLKKENESKPEKKLNNEIRIKLYVDQRETRGSEVVNLLEKAGVCAGVKTLALGDFVFVAESGDKCFVLDLIVERKSASDLNSSHFSNHLRDQIRRLKTAKAQMKVLLVEGKSNFSIISEVWLRHGIRIVNVANQGKMIDFLKQFFDYFSSQITNFDQLSENENFEEFQKRHLGGETVGQIFYRQILEFPGMTSKKLNLFISLYPTMIDFLQGFQESKALVHQNLAWCGIGSQLESAIFDFFGMKR